MAQWLICPKWEYEKYTTTNDRNAGVFERHSFTHITISNPTDKEGKFGLVFVEANYRDDGCPGSDVNVSSIIDPKDSIVYTPSPENPSPANFRDGTPCRPRNLFYGWFEVWMSLDEMVIDVNIRNHYRQTIGTAVHKDGFWFDYARTINVHKSRPKITITFDWFRRNPDFPTYFASGLNIQNIVPVLDDD